MLEKQIVRENKRMMKEIVNEDLLIVIIIIEINVVKLRTR